MDAAIPPTGKREADPPTAEEEQDAKKLKHGEEEDKVDPDQDKVDLDLKELLQRYRSESSSELEAREKMIDYLRNWNRRLNREELMFLSTELRGDRPPPSPPSSPDHLPSSPDHDRDYERGYGSEDELPKGYGWASYDPALGGKDFVTTMRCARCGKAKDHWPDKCPEKKGEGSLFKRYGWIKPSTSTE